MITNLFKSLKLTLAFCAFFGVCYVFVLWMFALAFAPGKGNVELVKVGDKAVGAANIGQQFTQNTYFWGRPSSAGDGYDATRSAGSNKGPSNAAYLTEVQTRIDTFLLHHPYLKRDEVPTEMVTASASGLDPDISPKAAFAQAPRIAQARGLSEEKIFALITKHTELPLLGFFGTEKVNVLMLNIALDEMAAEN